MLFFLPQPFLGMGEVCCHVWRWGLPRSSFRRSSHPRQADDKNAAAFSDVYHILWKHFFGEKYQSSSFARDKLGELGKVH